MAETSYVIIIQHVDLWLIVLQHALMRFAAENTRNFYLLHSIL